MMQSSMIEIIQFQRQLQKKSRLTSLILRLKARVLYKKTKKAISQLLFKG